ncbi:MAG: hypothetical protein GY716_06855, partial [bacterium]|nr:hypothetical protein [bacterium]
MPEKSDKDMKDAKSGGNEKKKLSMHGGAGDVGHLTSPEQDPVDRRLQSAGGGAGDVEHLTSPEQDPVDRRLQSAGGGAGDVGH